MSKLNTKDIPAAADHEIPALIDRAVAVRAEIAKLTTELKIIETKLSKAAQLRQHEPLKNEQREGRQVILRSARYSLPIRFSSDELIKSFPDQGPKHKELLAILADAEKKDKRSAEDLLALFFWAPRKWEARYEDGQKFRGAAAEWLGPEAAPKFIAACRAVDKHNLPKSKTIVALDDVEPIEEVQS